MYLLRRRTVDVYFDRAHGFNEIDDPFESFCLFFVGKLGIIAGIIRSHNAAGYVGQAGIDFLRNERNERVQ